MFLRLLPLISIYFFIATTSLYSISQYLNEEDRNLNFLITPFSLALATGLHLNEEDMKPALEGVSDKDDTKDLMRRLQTKYPDNPNNPIPNYRNIRNNPYNPNCSNYLKTLINRIIQTLINRIILLTLM